MPFSWVRSAEVNGKEVEMALVFMLRRIINWSVAIGIVEFIPCSCWEVATLEKIMAEPK